MKSMKLGLPFCFLVFARQCFGVAPVTFTPGNVLVTYLPNGSTHISIRECTPTGATVQDITTPFTEAFPEAIGLTFDNQNRVVINYDDQFAAKSYLGVLDPATGIWQSALIGLPTSGDDDRDLSVFQNYAFSRNRRVNLNDFSVTTFDPGLFNGVSEASVGLDGKAYALNGGSPVNQIQKVDPQTLQNIGGVQTAPGFPEIQGISAATNGDIFFATNPGVVYHYDSNLNLINSLTIDLPGSRFNPYGLKLYQSGQIVMGDRDGRVVLTDTSLNSYTSFAITAQSAVYAALVPVPEPSTLALAALGALAFLAVRRRFF